MNKPKATKRMVYECNWKKCSPCNDECSLTTDKDYAMEGDEGTPVTAVWEEVPSCQ